MKKRLLSCLLILLPLVAMAQVEEKKMTVGEAVTLVKRYYDAFAKCAQNHGVGDESFELLRDLYSYCDGGMYMPIANEFYQMLDKGEGGESPNTQLSRFNRTFLNLSIQEGMHFSYKISGKPELRRAFSMDNDDTNTRAVLLKVKKMYDLRGKRWEYTDTIGVNLVKGQICQVTNRVYSESMLMKKSGDLTADQCKMLALASYDRKDYDNAFDLLQKALKKQPDEEIMYLLGVMAHRRQGGFKQYPRKVCSYMALFYFNQSSKGRFWLSTNMNYDYFQYFSDNETEPFSHNRMPAINTRTWKVGYITPTGKMIIPQKYTFGTSFDSQGRAYVKEKGIDSLFVIDTNGKRIGSYYFDLGEGIGLNAICVWTGDKGGAIDRRNGSWLVPMSEKNVIFWRRYKGYGYYVYMYMEKNNQGLYGLRRIDGKVLLPCEYRNIAFVNDDNNDGLFCRVRFLVNYDKAKFDSLNKKYHSISAIPEKKLEGIGEMVTVDVYNWE